MQQTLWALIFLCADAKVVELTPENWQEKIVDSGKLSFVKFFAPWCGHCKKLKPDWDALGDAYSDDSNVLIGDVDCTGGAKSLCEQYDIKGYPTLKTFWRSFSEDYAGSRSFADLKEFADQMKPKCTPFDLENCSPEQKEFIEYAKSLGNKGISEKLQEMRKKITSKEEEHQTLLKTLQEQYSSSQEELQDLKNGLQKELIIMEMLLSDGEKDEL